MNASNTGGRAEVLCTLAKLEGRPPEEVALGRIARGVPLSFSSSLGDDPQAMSVLARAMFDGPSDLAAQQQNSPSCCRPEPALTPNA
ncbi:hypothetical protein OG601_11455 [Streptomyces sp. NBC_01239]|uniref:hypothetical protein n=1 Tax=Streptomyces sp. NBC_01239 TaxID=2903792 RepID=UPI00224CD618|nr:hypothetical protein [Streptomyces sp. NBC_01239]MCX4811238.1 hypothetical protein [Streptomyces sp. NBC_01239]